MLIQIDALAALEFDDPLVGLDCFMVRPVIKK